MKIEQLDNDGFFMDDTREIGDPFQPDAGRDPFVLKITKGPKKGGGQNCVGDLPPPGVGTQIGMLFDREIKNLQRDVMAVVARFGLTAVLGLLTGIIFFDIGESDPSNPGNLNSHFGALVIIGQMAMFGSAQPALLAFPTERPVFLREYSTNHYSVVSYFLSRFTMEVVITAAQILFLVR
jgi:ABC-2 type transporter